MTCMIAIGLILLLVSCSLFVSHIYDQEMRRADERDELR